MDKRNLEQGLGAAWSQRCHRQSTGLKDLLARAWNIITEHGDTPLYLKDDPILHEVRLSRALYHIPGPIISTHDETGLLDSLHGRHFKLGRLMIMGLHRLKVEDYQAYSTSDIR